jgi:hypothetical protein
LRRGYERQVRAARHASLGSCRPPQLLTPWWENETSWHREWKHRFPESFREIAHVASDGEIHRADIKTEKGAVIEVQHSAMSDAERLSREAFYRNLVWIIDGRPFRKSFEIFHGLPDPHSELGKDVVWYKARRHLAGTVSGMFFRLSVNRVHCPDLSKSNIVKGMVEVHGWRDIEEQIRECYRGHHQDLVGVRWGHGSEISGRLPQPSLRHGKRSRSYPASHGCRTRGWLRAGW